MKTYLLVFSAMAVAFAEAAGKPIINSGTLLFEETERDCSRHRMLQTQEVSGPGLGAPEIEKL
jgi:hypothetical protein